MPKAVIKTTNLFPKNTLKNSLIPKIVDIKDIWNPGILGEDNSFGAYKKSLTIEFYCPVDQRVLYDGMTKISKISSFLCGYDLKNINGSDATASKSINSSNPQELNDAIYDMQQINQDALLDKIRNLIHFTDFELYQYGAPSHLNSESLKKLNDNQAFGVKKTYRLAPSKNKKTKGRKKSR